MPTMTHRHSRHVRELSDLLAAIMRDRTRPAENRMGAHYWAKQLRRFFGLAIDRGMPVHKDAKDPLIPDEIFMVEAAFMVKAAPWLAEWHGDARATLKEFHCGSDDPREGTFSWNAWCGGVDPK